MPDISIQSKVHKSAAQKERKRKQHEENQSLRAQLHAEKANANWREKANVQDRIDRISRKG